MVVSLGGSLISEILIIIAIFAVLYIIFKMGNLILGLLANIILGFIAIFALNLIFGLGISFDIIVLIIVAILGLPGAAIVVILHLIGIAL
jgi:inhibitor of the pro-sigma K processing machinery